MRRAGLVVADSLAAVQASARPGMTTAELDLVAADVIRSAGATPSFLGYHGYPATVCVSVNEEVVHGIPGSRVLVEGDVVSIDCGAIIDGWHGDSALTFVLGDADPADEALSRLTERAMWAGIAALASADRLGAGLRKADGRACAARAVGVARLQARRRREHGPARRPLPNRARRPARVRDRARDGQHRRRSGRARTELRHRAR